jgi:hypothetical protein
MKAQIIIKKVDKLPDYIIENSDEYWDFPFEELDFLFEEIEDGLRENNSTMLLFENRLYETEESEC